MKKINRVIISSVVVIMLVVSVGYYFFPLPVADDIDTRLASQLIIEEENSFETQVHNECSAFSSAYVLRHFGESITGMTLYESLNFKLPLSGYVLPNGILSYFHELDYDITMFSGTLNQLKMRLGAGVPIIVLVGEGVNWQHYMTLIGYNTDLKELYFFDSLRKEDENAELPGNRTLTEDYFLSMWDNGLPIFNHLYFVINR
ncbi:MAG TPA: hypothetical protein DCY20_06730 [Firmicutes bacterium]|nr:hypothetical protein [Bacillota bacterium]